MNFEVTDTNDERLALKSSLVKYYSNNLQGLYHVLTDKTTNILWMVDIPYRNNVTMNNIKTLLKLQACEVDARKEPNPIP
jgi:hypothetical protein